MDKIKTLSELVKITKNLKKKGKSVGLITGSFDICHLGHLSLFRFAKKYVDVLIVGLDHDETIRKTKGKNRPINNFKRRARFLSDLETVDRIFLLENISLHGSKKSYDYYGKVLRLLKPTYIFTHKICDRHWREKKQIAEKLGINFVLDKSKKVTTSGEIIQKLETEL